MISKLKYTVLSLLIIFACGAAHAVINGVNVTVTASTLCNNGTIEKNFVGGCPGAWNEGAIQANTAPTISLNGASTVTYTEGDTYNELGATCTDTEDGSITVPAPAFAPALNMAAAGSYVATYTCTDSGSLTDTATRTINVNSGASSALAFTDVTSTAIPSQTLVTDQFDIDFFDANSDGEWDIFVGSHSNDDSALYTQSGGVFTYRDVVAGNYSQSPATNPRTTGQYNFLDLDGDSDWDFFAWDADGAPAAKYLNTTSGAVTFGTKSTGCPLDNDFCLVGLINNDNDLDFVSVSSYSRTSNANRRRVADVQTNTEHFAAIADGDTTTPCFGNDRVMLISDFDGDTWSDIMVPDGGGYWKNNNGTSLTCNEVMPSITGWDSTLGGGKQLAADFDNDGDLDLIVFQFDASSTVEAFIFRNDGAGNMTQITDTAAGLDNLTWAATFNYSPQQWADLDLDGDFDLILSGMAYGGNTIQVYENLGNMTFARDTSIAMEMGHYFDTRDYDNDGDIDLVKIEQNISSTNIGIKLYRNDVSNSNNWLKFDLTGSGNNTQALGAAITVYEAGTSNVITYIQQQITAFQNTLNPHVGVGAASLVDVKIDWPNDGGTCTFSNVVPNSTVTADIATCLSASTMSTTMTLVADAAITPTATELVTFGLPFEEGVVTDISELKVSIGGSEVAAYVESTLTHHWSDNSIRAATIQLQNVDMTGGDVTVTIDDTGASVARLTEQPHANGWTTAGADKDNLQYPRIFALHNPQYLADSGIVPPFKPAPDTQDAFEDYQVAQFTNNFGSLDYQASSGSNWLFDRSSAMFKVYMTTGRVEFLKEAFLSKQFYFQHVRNDGTTPTASGGDGCWTYGGTACADGKYIAPQQAKLALALVGDDSQWTNALIVDMALQADVGWNQPYSRGSQNAVAENVMFTERGAGLIGLAEIIAYEMTGDATVLSHLNERIAFLKAMQDVQSWDTANGWTPKSGAFTHAISRHEGDSYPGDGTANDRGFSPWMSENIADFLWQAYWVTGNTSIPGLLRGLASAVDDYGFTSVYNASTGNHDTHAAFAALGDPIRAQGCNTTRADTSITYFGSKWADMTTRTSGDWYPYYSDSHNIETTLIYAVGLYFETDPDIRTRLMARADKLVDGWSNSSCAGVFGGIYRLFNWQHRSNSVRTYDWVKEAAL